MLAFVVSEIGAEIFRLVIPEYDRDTICQSYVLLFLQFIIIIFIPTFLIARSKRYSNFTINSTLSHKSLTRL